MIRINLLPTKESEHAVKRRQQMSLAILGIAILLLGMVLVNYFQRRTLNQLVAQANEIQEEIQKYEEQTKEARDLERKKRELTEKVRVIRDLDVKRVGPARVLSDLSEAVPEKLWVEEFVESNDVATLTGWSLDNQTVANFMRQLEGSLYFNRVDLAEATQPEQPMDPARNIAGIAGLQLKRFVIKSALDYFGRGGRPPSENGTPPGAAGAQPGAPAEASRE